MYSVISGTNRPGSNSSQLAVLYGEMLKDAGCESQVLLLESLPHDFVFSASYGRMNPDFDRIVDTYVRSVDKFVFVVPEYNGSIPGVLKAFIDCIPPELFHGKKAALVGLSAGRAGNLRGMEDMTGILHYLQVEVLSKKPKLSVYRNLTDGTGRLIDEKSIAILSSQIEKFKSF